METRIICIMQQKGGVGKTMTTAALGRCLAARGERVLLLDCDPQQNLTLINGLSCTDILHTLHDVFTGQASIQDAIRPVLLPSLDLITGGLRLASFDMQFGGQLGREHLLSRALQPIKDNYDYIIIDTPPSLGLMSVTAATAANEIIIPMDCSILAIQGLSQLWEFLNNIRSYYNTKLRINGILLTMYDSRSLTTKGLEHQIETAATAAGSKVYQTRIRFSQSIKTSQARQDTSLYSKSNINAIQDYMDFAAEVIKEGGTDE